MKKSYSILRLLIVVLLLSSTFNASAKKASKRNLVEKEAVNQVDAIQAYTTEAINSFMSYYGQGIDEKLYIQTDKPYYSTGEQIWLKGYLLNAITHAPLKISNFIYVELLKEDGSMLSRIKVRRDSMGFNGYIKLDPMMEPGNYSVRGYTKWMANKDEGFFHNKAIKIVSAVANVEKSDAAEVDAAEAKRLEKERAKAAEAEAKAKAAAEAEAKKVLEYDVQFFPEGGALLAGIPQIVAFKAIASDGLSKEVTGSIYNSNDELIAEMRSMHKGMGMVQMVAVKGEKYYAIVQCEEGLERHFELPKVEESGVSIQLTRTSTGANYVVHATDPALLEGGHVIIHSRGKIIAAMAAENAKPRAISSNILLDGVSAFSVVNRDQKIISERIIFKRPTAMPTIDIVPNATNFQSRSFALIKVNVKDSEGAAAQGDFAVSVTDNNSVVFDPTKESMLSYLLLSSEIKGNIEDSGAYFAESGAASDGRIDLLMRTQGWRRFNLEKVLTKTVEKPKTLYEDLAHISGTVKGFFGNEARKPKVAVLCSKLNFIDVFDLDESSKFRLVGLNIPDSTTYIVRAQGRKGGGSMTLKIDPEIYPKTIAALFERKRYEEPVPQEFVNQSKDKFYYEGGMQTIMLESITVSTSKVTKESESGIIATQSQDRETLNNMSGLLLSDILLTIPGIKTSMTDGEYAVYYRDATDEVRFIVDGIDEEYVNISNVLADDIEQLDFFSGADAAVFSDSSGGVVTIAMREQRTSSEPTPPNIAFVSHLGYQHPAKFYQPKYEIASVKRNSPPDFRSTIYWDGDLKADKDGNISFGFYTADKPTSYTITIEGITTDGEVCYGTKSIERTLGN